MHIRILVALLAVLLASPAWAQTPAVSYDLVIYTPGNPTPQTRNVLATAVQCNLPVPTTTNINPTSWFWNDPQFTGRLCKADDATRLAALPDGMYNGTVFPVDANGLRGQESASAPFTRQRPLLPPVAVTGVRLAQ